MLLPSIVLLKSAAVNAFFCGDFPDWPESGIMLPNREAEEEEIGHETGNHDVARAFAEGA